MHPSTFTPSKISKNKIDPILKLAMVKRFKVLCLYKYQKSNQPNMSMYITKDDFTWYTDTNLETLHFRKNKLVLEGRLLTFAYI